jgi:Predicted signal transduction protein with a C-terminal ATPase domain
MKYFSRLPYKIKKKYLDLSIRWKINILYITLTVISLGLLATIPNQISSGVIINKTIQSCVQNLNLVTENINNMINHAEDLSRIIVPNSYIQEAAYFSEDTGQVKKFEYDFIIRGVFDGIIQNGELVYSIVAHFYNGNIFSSSKIDTEKYTNNVDNHIDGLKGKSINGTSCMVYDTQNIANYTDQSRRNVLKIARPIISVVSAREVGMLEMNILEEKISNIYADLLHEQSGKIFIANDDGMIISSLDKNELYSNINDKNYFQWAKRLDNQGKILNINGVRHLVISKHIKSLEWIIIGIVPLSEVMTENYRVIITNYIIGIACIIISCILVYFLSKFITKPIIELSEIMSLTGEGDFEIRAKEYSNDEIGLLSKKFNDMIMKISHLVDKIYVEQRSKRKYELAALQEQIKPHFLYNTLDSISALVQLSQLNEGLSMLKSLSLFYKISLSRGRTLITVEEELNIVKSYLEIQEMRFKDKFIYFFEIDEGILKSQIIKLTLQPLVENSIHHGLRECGYKGVIGIKGILEGNMVKISIIDNGNGFNVNILNKELSHNSSDRSYFGLRSINERLKLYFGNEYGIEKINSEKGFTEVIIVIPYQTDRGGY